LPANSSFQLHVKKEKVSDSYADISKGKKINEAKQKKEEARALHLHDFGLLPLVNKVRLVTHKHYDNILSSLSAHLIYPASKIKKRLPVCIRNMSKN